MVDLVFIFVEINEFIVLTGSSSNSHSLHNEANGRKVSRKEGKRIPLMGLIGHAHEYRISASLSTSLLCYRNSHSRDRYICRISILLSFVCGCFCIYVTVVLIYQFVSREFALCNDARDLSVREGKGSSPTNSARLFAFPVWGSQSVSQTETVRWQLLCIPACRVLFPIQLYPNLFQSTPLIHPLFFLQLRRIFIFIVHSSSHFILLPPSFLSPIPSNISSFIVSCTPSLPSCPAFCAPFISCIFVHDFSSLTALFNFCILKFCSQTVTNVSNCCRQSQNAE